MTVTQPLPDQLGHLRQLWKQAFGDSDAFLDGFFATGFSPDRCRCITWNDRVAAALYWFDCDWDGKKLAYIYAVATDETFRGKGFCRKLMEQTHRYLQDAGYRGAVLVPGSRSLFELYGKLGYRSFSPRLWREYTAGQEKAEIRALTPRQYGEKRQSLLPAGGIRQDEAALSYLSTFAGFFEGAGCLFCGGGEAEFAFQEFFGDLSAVPAILAALGANAGRVPCAGEGSAHAMYLPLTESEEQPSYFGLALN